MTALACVPFALALLAPLPAQEPDAAERAALEKLAARCGQELHWAKDWDEAAARAQAEQKPVLAVAWLYPGLDVADGVSLTFASDADVAELVNERCIPLRIGLNAKVPFAEQEVYGLSATAFGAALLLVAPDGRVLADSPFLEPGPAYDFLCAALAAQPGFAGASESPGLAPEESAARALARGELDTAEKRLGAPHSARAYLLRARLARLRHDAPGARAAIAAARALEPGPLAAELDVEELSLQLAAADAAGARATCERLERDSSAREEARVATYAQALLDLAANDRPAALRRWRALTKEHAESRWAALAAASMLLPPATFADYRLGDTPLDVLASLAVVPFSRLAPGATTKAADSALQWLTRARRADGTWPDPSELGRARGGPPSAISDAIDGLATRALLAHRDTLSFDLEQESGRVIAAARASLAGRTNGPAYMTYEVWSDALCLELLADLIEAPAANAKALRALGSDVAEALAARQRTNGGWSYFEAASLDPRAPKLEQSISFVTASVVLALERAQAAGIDFDDELLGRGLDALEAMRGDDGVFAYFLWSSQKHAPRETQVAGAAGRGPLCELALLRAGRSDQTKLRAAIERFFQNAPTLAKELGKALMHCGPQGQGCHYVLYDYATAARAIAALPVEEQKPYRARLLVLLDAARRADGAFLDTPILGPASGTALVLLALDWLHAGAQGAAK